MRIWKANERKEAQQSLRSEARQINVDIMSVKLKQAFIDGGANEQQADSQMSEFLVLINSSLLSYMFVPMINKQFVRTAVNDVNLAFMTAPLKQSVINNLKL